MITRESYWTANSYHGNSEMIKIKDLEDSHIVNIVLYIKEHREETFRGHELMSVLYDEIKVRGLQSLVDKGEYIPFISRRTKELVRDTEPKEKKTITITIEVS